MQICFSLPHILSAQASQLEAKNVHQILSQALTAINQPLLASRAVSGHSANGATSGLLSSLKRGEHNCMCFVLPTFFRPGSEQTEDDRVLRILLEALIAINMEYRRRRHVPHLYDRPVYYARTQVWDPTPALDARGYGDCKSLTADLIAKYRLDGYECAPVFRWERARGKRKGGTNYHILVQTAQGFEDPSKVKGMGRSEY